MSRIIPISLAPFLIGLCHLFMHSQVCGVVHLKQSDFNSGTYRIKIPDTYILDENIEFEPVPALEAQRTDKPAGGWFAVITVETDNVVIDLNGKTLETSQFFTDNDLLKVFADIELDNSPFPGILYGLVGASFPDAPFFVSANNAVVKNGVLGRSPHWGIRGNNNSDIEINDLHIKDFEVAAISLNGLLNASIHDIEITGNEHVITVSFLKTGSIFLMNYLASLAEQGFPGASEQLAALVPFVNQNPQIFNTISPIPPNAMSGIQITSGFSSATTFPTTPEDCAFAAFLADGRQSENITIENVHVKGLKSAPQETPLIASQVDGLTAFNLGLSGALIIGCGRWIDAFDEKGNFAPNPFLQAMVFAANVNPNIFLPPNWEAISKSILVPDEAAFLKETFPNFGHAFDDFTVKGNFAFRIDCSAKVTLKNCTADDVQNLGAPGIELSQLPDAQFYPYLVQTRYAGNDIWGFESSSSDQVKMSKCKASSISTLRGDSFGFHLATNGSDMVIENCKSKEIFGFGDNTVSIVNPPSVAYGFNIANNSGPVTLYNNCAEKIIAPRFAFGIEFEQSDNVDLNDFSAHNIGATSPNDLASPKEAFGIFLNDASNTRLKNVSINDVHIFGERGACTSNSTAAGISIDSASQNTLIICPKINHIRGGAGKAFKIDDQGKNTVIKGCNHRGCRKS